MATTLYNVVTAPSTLQNASLFAPKQEERKIEKQIDNIPQHCRLLTKVCNSKRDCGSSHELILNNVTLRRNNEDQVH